MKIKLTIILLLISNIIIAETPPKEEKRKILYFNSEINIQSTFSSNIGKNSSLHLIIGKSELKAYIADKNLNIRELNTFTIPKKAKVIGQHINGEIVTLILSFSKGNNSFIQIYDLNFYNNSIIISDVFNNDNQIIATSTDHHSFIIYSNQESISIRKITSSKESNYSTINFVDKPGLYKLFKKNYHYQFINQKQYIPTAPFSYAHAYINNNEQFIFILDYKRKFKFAKIDPEHLNNSKVFEIEKYPKSVDNHGIRFNAKYYYNDHVFFFYGSAQASELKIINVNTHEIEKVITLLPDNEYVKKIGKSNHYTFKKYLRSIQAGTKEASITVNELTNNQYVSIRLDYSQPNNKVYYHGYTDVSGGYIGYTTTSKKTEFDYEKDSDYTYHYITLNTDFDFIEIEDLKYKKLKMNKLMYIEFAEKRNLKHTSHVFLNDKYRSFSYDKNLDKFVLKLFK